MSKKKERNNVQREADLFYKQNGPIKLARLLIKNGLTLDENEVVEILKKHNGFPDSGFGRWSFKNIFKGKDKS